MCGYENGSIVVMGGTNWEGGKKNWLQSVHTYLPSDKLWKANVAKHVSPVAYAIGVQLHQFFVVVGGYDGKQPLPYPIVLGDGRTHEVNLRTLPTCLTLAAGGTVAGSIIVVGGTADPADFNRINNATHAILPGDNTWKVGRLADYPGKPFATAASVVLGSELFVFGGMNYDAEAKLPVNSAEAYAFSPEKNVWRKLTPLASPTRGLTAVTLDESHIYIAGGYREDFTAEAVIYDVKADSYRKAIALPYAAMVGLVRMGDHVYCLGGEDKKQSRTDKFFRISVAELLK